jgi:pimeloyl-ACP methyl ester carboxylesterase
MSTIAPRAWTPARLVAIALIAVVTAGLAYLRVGTGPDPVSVPEGAAAGDLVLEDCEYATEKGSYAADCGTLVVPENRADPKSRLIALPVTRIRAQSKTAAEPVFRLEGGPGKTNMEFTRANRFAEDRDVVLVGYRGADGSQRLDCPEVVSALGHSPDFGSPKSFRAYGDAFRDCAARLTDEGVDLAGYNVVERVDDLEAARVAFGYDRIDLLSESAGTRYAMVYAWRYPQRVHRSVMVAVNPPGHFVWDGNVMDEQVRRYAALCAKDDDCSGRTDDLAATIRQTNRDMPGRWGILRIAEGNVGVETHFGLFESSVEAAGPLAAPVTIDSWISAEKGDASGFWFQSLISDLAFPESFIWGELAAIGSADDDAAERYFSRRDHREILGSPGNDLIWGGGELVDAWPGTSIPEYDRVRDSAVETLLIGGELDFSTPPQIATKELLPHLPNGHEVVIPAMGHSGTFWTEQPAAGTHLINTFHDSGRVDDSHYEPMRVDFSPDVTAPALAKGVAGVMVGLAVVMLLSLAWMARRVRRRGAYGPKAAAVLRSVYSVVLGLGGWFLGVLVVSTTMPSVSLADGLLATVMIGVPIGLGIYLAWLDPDWSPAARAAGFAAAAAGAVAGAWLGFHTTGGLAALFTTIAGATAGSNLVLLALDIARARTPHDRAAEHAADPLVAQPAVG